MLKIVIDVKESLRYMTYVQVLTAGCFQLIFDKI